jgi:hypothetical protein
MSRSSTEQGADKAANLRRGQARERGNLQNDISRAQGEITKLQEQRAPIASQARQIEAEVGPIKYIAALIYGDNPDANLLEKAVRWVIILIVIVFDPLALTLLLAATKTFEWERENQSKVDDEDLNPDVRSWFDRARDRARFWDQQPKEKPAPWPFPQEFEGVRINGGEWIQTGPELDVPHEQEPAKSQPTVKQSVLVGLDSMWSRARKLARRDSEAEHAPLDQPISEPVPNQPDPIAEGDDTPDKFAERAWKVQNPTDTLKRQRHLLATGVIAELPWNDARFRTQVLGQQGPEADNMPTGAIGEMKGFGINFPADPIKGDMFLRVDRLPSVLFKYNGHNWIEVDKALSDNHAYDDDYIDHLIEKIGSGEYDPELLSEAERDRIEQKLQQNPSIA